MSYRLKNYKACSCGGVIDKEIQNYSFANLLNVGNDFNFSPSSIRFENRKSTKHCVFLEITYLWCIHFKKERKTNVK